MSEEKKYINVIVTPEEKNLFKEAGEKIGIRRESTFLRLAGLEKAKKLLEE